MPAKEDLIKFIRENDPCFQDARFENYSYHELVIIKVSIEIEREKCEDYKPIGLIAKLL